MAIWLTTHVIVWLTTHVIVGIVSFLVIYFKIIRSDTTHRSLSRYEIAEIAALAICFITMWEAIFILGWMVAACGLIYKWTVGRFVSQAQFQQCPWGHKESQHEWKQEGF